MCHRARESRLSSHCAAARTRNRSVVRSGRARLVSANCAMPSTSGASVGVRVSVGGRRRALRASSGRSTWRYRQESRCARSDGGSIRGVGADTKLAIIALSHVAAWAGAPCLCTWRRACRTARLQRPAASSARSVCRAACSRVRTSGMHRRCIARSSRSACSARACRACDASRATYAGASGGARCGVVHSSRQRTALGVASRVLTSPLASSNASP